MPPTACSNWGDTFDFSDCYYDEWADAAVDYVSNSLGIDITQFKYASFILPPGMGSLCGFFGTAWYGCGGQGAANCRSYIGGDPDANW